MGYGIITKSVRIGSVIISLRTNLVREYGVERSKDRTNDYTSFDFGSRAVIVNKLPKEWFKGRPDLPFTRVIWDLKRVGAQ